MTIKLSQDQQDALDDILIFLAQPEPGEMALVGAAGTGKTMLTRFILNEARTGKNLTMWKLLFNNKSNINIELTSSTNKAASVLSDSTGEPAQTIHKLLKLRVLNDLETGHSKVVKTKKTGIITNTLIVIDEGSMINSNLLKMIRDCTKNCKVLYILDEYQLAPVRENISPVAKDVIKQVKLTTIQRQVAGSPIIQFASKFKKALDTEIFPVIQTYGTNVIHLSDADFQKEIDNQFSKSMYEIPSRIIAWSNARVHQYNNYVRSLHNSNTDYRKGELLITNAPIMAGDARVYKGDALVEITYIEESTQENIKGWEIVLDNNYKVFQALNMLDVTNLLKHYAKHKDWPNYFRIKESFVDLRPYYSTTINKAQGSTYKNVFIDVADIGRNSKKSEIARLMYTAVTRASNTVYMRGDLPPRLY